jgi:4-amino-4-deoxychorismate lyase
MRFIETLLIKDKIENLLYHNIRMNTTRAVFFGKDPIDLENFIEIKPNTRCRVLYDENIIKVEYFELKDRKFEKLKIVYSDIEYNFKYENREKLNNLKVDGYDEVVIVKNGYITDTTISNLAFFDGKEWHTPAKPLLEGTKRMELLEKGFLKEKNIKLEDLYKYKKVAMINAILGFYEVGGIDSIKI